MILASASSCKKINEENCGDAALSSPLTLSVRTGIHDLKSMITDTFLETGEEIGVSLTDGNGNSYDGIQYSNVRFRSSGTSAVQSWDADYEIMLSANKGVLYAYYPYSADVTDIRSIPVTSTSEIQTDYMYAEPVNDLNNHNSEATVTLRHALAAIRIILKRGTYTGTGKITAISVSGNNLATGGILNATDGSLNTLTGTGATISPDISPIALDPQGKSIDILAVPTGKSSGLDIKLTMDGEEFSVTTEATVLNKGMISVFEININNSSVTIDPVKVKAWDLGHETSTSLQKNWHVTFGGDMDDISINSTIGTDGKVTIIATPKYRDAEINPVTVNGNADIVESLQNGVRTIILSDISSDISIEFNSYILWVTAVYNITSTTSETQLLHQNTQCKRLEIDGQEVEASNMHMFDSTGDHIVRIVMPNKDEIPTNAFYNIKALSSITIPDGVKTLNTRCLSTCFNLTSVSLPQTVIHSGYEVMSHCTSLKSVELPEKLDMGYGMFSNCYSIEDVTLPKNLQTLRKSTFFRCGCLENIYIPESVTKIENNAFASSGLISVTLPVGLKSIGKSSFGSCSNLCNIRYSDGTEYSSELVFKEGLEIIDDQAFLGCRQITSVHIPSTVTKIGSGALTTAGVQSISVAEGNPYYFTVEGFTGIIESSSGTLVSGAINSTVIPAEATRIGDYAYCYLSISSVDLHDKITYIGDWAFYSTTNRKLKTIISRSSTPPELGSIEVFGGGLTGGILMVPESAIETYSSSSWMKQESGFLGKLSWTVEALTDN